MEAIFGRIGFMGAGAMAEGLIRGLLGRGVPASSIWASDVSEARLKVVTDTLGINTTQSNHELVEMVGTIVIAVKPQVLPVVLDEVREGLVGHIVVSIAAGVSIRAISGRLPEGVPVIRAMPNTPCTIGRGAIGMAASEGCHPIHKERAKGILSAAGTVVEVPEHLLDSVTGVSGSGPAYVFTFIEALIDAGVKVGLPREVARALALETVIGAAELVKQSGAHPAVLRDAVTSPGGTTIAALSVLEASGFRSSVFQAVEAATFRARELGLKAEGSGS